MRYLTDPRFGNKPGRFFWENPSDPDNVLNLFRNEKGGLSIAVSEEHAVDSYNSTFECSAFLTEDEGVRLRDYLNAAFPKLSE